MEKFPYDFPASAIGRVYTSEGDRCHRQQQPPAASAAMDALSHWTAQRKTAGKLPARPLAPL